MKRGEVWWASLSEPMGRRPVVLLTRDGAYRFLNAFTAASLTRSIRKIVTHVAVGPGDGVPQESVVNLDDLQSVGKEQLTERICELTPSRMREVDDALMFALGLDS